jgi:ABC-type methionine transport system ATPase subunit
VIIRRAWGKCKVKSVLLRRRCSLEGKIWYLDKGNIITESQVEQVFTSRDSLLGKPLFKVEYDDTKRRYKRKVKQRQKEKLNATLAENSSTELTAGLRH